MTSAGTVVKNAWNRQTSNRDAWSGPAGGPASGMRRTTRRPETCCDALADANAVKGISATSARDTQTPVASSRMAFGYLIVVHAPAGIDSIARCTSVFWRTVRRASATIRPAPRAEPAEPLRSRVATITGAPPGAVTVAADALSPRTPE